MISLAKFMFVGALLAVAGSAHAIDLQLGDNVEFENTQSIRVDQGEVKTGVFYKVVGFHLSDDERLVTAELKQFFTPLDKRDLDQMDSHPEGATITFENVPRLIDVKGVRSTGRGAIMH